jgi:hypothetical protein
MTTRSIVGSCLLGLWATANASAQVVVLSPPIPVLIPEPIPVVVGPPPAVAVPAGTAPAGTAPKADSTQSNYPASTEAQSQRPLGPRVVHERHYLSPTMNVSNYMASKSSQQYGPETVLVVRDYFVTDEPPPKASTTPPPVGSAEDRRSTAPKNSTDAEMDRMLGTQSDRKETSTGVKAPDPSAADNGQRKTGEPGRINYPPNDEFIGPPRPPAEPLAVENATRVSVASRNGGTPMAEMELNFVDLAGKHNDVKGRTDGKGEFRARLAPSRWQVFLVVGENERKSLGVILVKPSAGEPFKLQF